MPSTRRGRGVAPGGVGGPTGPEPRPGRTALRRRGAGAGRRGHCPDDTGRAALPGAAGSHLWMLRHGFISQQERKDCFAQARAPSNELSTPGAGVSPRGHSVGRGGAGREPRRRGSWAACWTAGALHTFVPQWAGRSAAAQAPPWSTSTDTGGARRAGWGLRGGASRHVGHEQDGGQVASRSGCGHARRTLGGCPGARIPLQLGALFTLF